MKTILSGLKAGFVILLLCAFMAGCGNLPVNDVGKVEGTVTDSSTSAALSGVTVQIGDKTATTGSNGVYSIQDISVGTRTVTASKTGYQNHNGNCEVSKGTTVTHNIQLSANPISDTTPPTVSSTSPTNNATNVAVNIAVKATFSEAMDVSTITTATFTLKQGTTTVAGTVTYTGTTATFTPSSSLSYSTSYTATVTTGAKDTAGNAIASDNSWSFTTGVAPDTTPPTVSSTNPANNATGVTVNSAITATFSEAMDVSTITTATFTLKQGTTTVAGTVTYTGTTATFTPSSSLSYSTSYTATIATGTKDTAENAMASDYSWSFTTGSALDTTPPTISSTSPANNATGIAVNSTITATFSEAMDVLTITTATFTLKQGTTPVSGAVTYSGTTATFTPSSNLSYSTSYTATITTGAKDTAGNAMASNYSWSFTTGVAPDTTPPTVSSTSPANTSTGVAVNTAITAIFSETMDASTVTTATFSLNNGVTGTVTYTGMTGTFTPSSNLSYSTSYTATVTTGVKDSAGNAMAAAYTWTFTTGAATASSGAIKLPKTGQTTSYATGDDGGLQKGVAWPNPRFTNADGTTPINGSIVVDQLTGLMWTADGNAPGPAACSPATTKTWQGALDYVACLNTNSYLGYTDWRLPNVNEHESLTNAGQSNSATWLNTQGFSNVQAQAGYWSSTTYASNTAVAWLVNGYNGYPFAYYKTVDAYVWPVRASQVTATAGQPKTGQTISYAAGDDGNQQNGVAWTDPRFTVGTGTEADCVTDNLTGLMWVKSPDSTTRTWADALTYADGLSLCGYTDWRLPNREELRSLANYGQSNSVTWLNAQGFSNVLQADVFYWSSTTHAYDTAGAWFVIMYDGSLSANGKSSSYYVWPVRGGQ